MCGLCGIVSATNIDSTEREAFDLLLNIGRYRGKDATGVSTYSHRTGDVVLGKCGGTPDFLWRRYPQLSDNKVGTVRNTNLNWIMGHNRKATRGKLCDKNSHPFHCRSLVGAHNGSLPFVQEGKLKDILRENGSIQEVEGETDSELLFMALASENSLKNIIEDKNVSGAMALSWWDTDPIFYLYRNSERPLSTMMSKNKKTLIYSSEIKFLRFAREYISTLDRLFDEPEIFPINKLHKIDFSGGELKIDIEEIKGSVTIHHYGGYNHTANWTYQQSNPGYKNSGILENKTKFQRKKKDQQGKAHSIKNKKMTRDEFYAFTMHECNCQHPVSYTDFISENLIVDTHKKVVYCQRKGCQNG